MNAKGRAILAAILAAASAPAAAEVIILRSGERLEGGLLVFRNRGIVLRKAEGEPGRYLDYEEISRITTKDGRLWYLMPRGAHPTPQPASRHFPLARVILPAPKRAAPVPQLLLPPGEAVEVSCAGAADSVTIELEGGGRVRLLGVAPPAAADGRRAARKAAEHLAGLVAGRTARLYPGPQGAAAGDAEAYVVVDNALVNARLLEHGRARVDEEAPDHPYREAFLSLEKFARTLGRGVWADARP
ncbi:MAG: thermonuclease family protein [bacterium]|nr:thermonuclease family protein [bacterium]